jgi:hypothetical protein
LLQNLDKKQIHEMTSSTDSQIYQQQLQAMEEEAQRLHDLVNPIGKTTGARVRRGRRQVLSPEEQARRKEMRRAYMRLWYAQSKLKKQAIPSSPPFENGHVVSC